MSTLAPVMVTPAWTLVYDTLVSGDFTGLVSTSASGGARLFVGPSKPDSDLFGTYFTCHQDVTLSASEGDKLYARCPSGSAGIIMDSSLVIGGSSAGGSSSVSGGILLTQAENAIKAGRMFEASWSAPLISPGTGAVITIQTGAGGFTLKNLTAQFDGASMELRLYRDAETSNGIEIPALNLNDVAQTQASAVISQSPDIADYGFPAATYVYAVKGQECRAPERILKPNTAYLMTAFNNSDAAQRMSGYLSWIESD